MYRNRNTMATASLVLAIISLFTVFTGFSTIFGGLAILLALLSRGSSRMSGQAKAAAGIGSCTLVVGFVVMIAYISFLLSSSEFHDTLLEYSEYYDEIYGDDSDVVNPYKDLLDLYDYSDSTI